MENDRWFARAATDAPVADSTGTPRHQRVTDRLVSLVVGERGCSGASGAGVMPTTALRSSTEHVQRLLKAVQRERTTLHLGRL